MKKFIFLGILPLLIHAAPDILSTPGLDSISPRVGMDQNANAIATWIENGFVKSKTKIDGQDWSALYTVSNSGATSLQMVVDLNGNTTAVWTEEGIAKGASKTLMGSWGSVSNLSSSGASSLQIAVDASGNVVVVWTRNGNVESATKLSGGSWPVVPDVILSTEAASPKVAIGGDGLVIAIWHGLVSSVYRISAAMKTIDGDWGLEELVSDPAHHAVNADLDIDPNGNTVAIWFRYDVAGSIFSNVIVQSASFNGMWSSPLDISNPGIYDPMRLKTKVRFDKSGDVIAIWNTSYDGSYFTIGAKNRNAFFNTWFETGDLTISLYSFDFDFGVYLGGEGDCKLVFQNFDPLTASIQIQSLNTDIDSYQQIAWSGPPLNLSIGNINVYPRIATVRLETDLKSAAVWENYNGSYRAIYADTRTENELQPPTNVSGVKNQHDFGCFTEFYNTLSWQPSPSSNVNGYVIYRNDLFLARLTADNVQFVDHNRGENEEDSYKISAIGPSWIQSARVVVNFPP